VLLKQNNIQVIYRINKFVSNEGWIWKLYN